MKPWRWLIYGIFCSGLKYPFDRIRGENADRYEFLKKCNWGFGVPLKTAEVEDALMRCKTNSNKRGLSHNATNLLIELAREWAVYEAFRLNDAAMFGDDDFNKENVLPGLLKAFSSLAVWSNIFWVMVTAGLVAFIFLR